MSEHCTVKLEDIAAAFELSPEEVEENDGNCEVRESSKVDNPFTSCHHHHHLDRRHESEIEGS